MVGVTRIELVTSSMSTRRSPAELYAHPMAAYTMKSGHASIGFCQKHLKIKRRDMSLVIKAAQLSHWRYYKMAQL